jgi:sulfonate transport system permease protein
MDRSLRAGREASAGLLLPRLRWNWRGLAWTGFILPLLLFVIWELAARAGLIEPRLLPPPSEVARTLYALSQNGLLAHVVVSIARVGSGFAIGAILGTAFGIAVGLNSEVESVIDPTFQALRAIPSLAWVPLLLLWLGIGETPKITLIALGAFFPVYLNVVTGLRNVDAKLIELGRSLQLSQAAMVTRILLPASLPNIFVGLRVGLSLSWMFLVAAELIAADRGLGYLLSEGRETSRPDIVLAAIVLLALLGKLTDGIVKHVQSRRLAWRDTLDTEVSTTKG